MLWLTPLKNSWDPRLQQEPPLPQRGRLNSLCYCTATAWQQRALGERRQEKTNSHPVLNVAVAETLLHPFSDINLGELICRFDSAMQYVPLRLLIITCNFFPFFSFFQPNPRLWSENEHRSGDISADVLGVCSALEGRWEAIFCLAELGPAMTYRTVSSQVSNQSCSWFHITAEMQAELVHTKRVASAWTVGPYWGIIKNANKNAAATSQGSWILTASFEPPNLRMWNLI